ncbi:FAD-binding oxidoreductase [Achromobacter sp. GG226]|uniref:FAD-binding oxidoreductase n=1 Tax=Verticiella alkaliphila TaxID=2779529 RepID=UPI001C0E5521|nr:FAD-binding oxidoreductase [Verticiella sp. GG226]MBU4611150.1 FAD-binding oxidoreductase [Verticiella sp. GG226]
MLSHGWGRWPVIRGDLLPVTSPAAAARLVSAGPAIARGLGRSYGDSALAAHMLDMRPYDWLIDFDPDTGRLQCAAGTTMDDIVSVFLPRGWFPAITPGTRFVTVGGAIASDVHGKNHHHHGCFSTHVDSIDIMLGDGSVLTCSRDAYPDLFHATCGGMGLTGVVLRATLRLVRVPGSHIAQTTRKARNLAHALEIFQAVRGATYSVAWLDCLARGELLGRALVTTGEHVAGPRMAVPPRALPVPFDLPGVVLNRHTVGAFNRLYYARERSARAERTVGYAPFFYPLDGLRDWNRLYGRAGFTQYQCVIPHEGAMAGLTAVLERIADSGKGSFLAVLKELGAANANPLSFPLAGYTLALDFRIEPDLAPLLEALDAIVLAHGGRVYLAKDARMSADTFRRGYPAWERFQAVRERYGAHGRFASVQSHRLGLEAW